MRDPHTDQAPKKHNAWISRAREALMNKPALTASGAGALGGAALMFLLNGQAEAIRQDTQVLTAIGAMNEQITLVLEGQDKIRGEQQRQSDRISALEQRSNELRQRDDDLHRKQQESEIGQHKLRNDMSDWMYRRTGAVFQQPGVIEETLAEILNIESENDESSWIARGAPYADTDVLSRRLGRRVSADERDQAAALILAARGLGHD